MMPPTSIDGTDITGATIDGTDVQEITVDGQTVFTAETLPIAYSDLVLWYPFDSSFYGGSDADDATALFNPAQSGDSTAYDGTVNGATYQSSGGVTDINAGANSGAYDFGVNDHITFTSPGGGNTGTAMLWVFPDSYNNNNQRTWMSPDNVAQGWQYFTGGSCIIRNENGTRIDIPQSNFTSSGSWNHLAITCDGSTWKSYLNGTLQGSLSSGLDFPAYDIINRDAEGNKYAIDGKYDDIRIYDKALSASQIDQIYQNTEP